MKGSTNTKRPRGRGNMGGKRPYQPPRNQLVDSSGPEVRVRGNAHQVMEKYLTMARDASSQGDRIAAENYYQHAEHYFRIISNAGNGNGRNRPQGQTPASDQNGGEDEAGEESGEEMQGGAEGGTDGPSDAVNA